MTTKENPTPAPAAQIINEYFIETLEHNRSNGLIKMFWRPSAQGYTYNVTEAGLYPKHEAEVICAKAEGRERMVHINEVMKLPMWNVVQNTD